MAARRRDRHPSPELERILLTAEAHGWTRHRGSRYIGIRCPCGRHQRWVHLTPSNPYYGVNLRMWLRRQPCWRSDGGA